MTKSSSSPRLRLPLLVVMYVTFAVVCSDGVNATPVVCSDHSAHSCPKDKGCGPIPDTKSGCYCLDADDSRCDGSSLKSLCLEWEISCGANTRKPTCEAAGDEMDGFKCVWCDSECRAAPPSAGWCKSAPQPATSQPKAKAKPSVPYGPHCMDGSDDGKGGLSAMTIFIMVASGVGLLLLVALFFVCRRRWRNRPKSQEDLLYADTADPAALSMPSSGGGGDADLT